MTYSVDDDGRPVISTDYIKDDTPGDRTIEGPSGRRYRITGTGSSAVVTPEGDGAFPLGDIGVLYAARRLQSKGWHDELRETEVEGIDGQLYFHNGNYTDTVVFRFLPQQEPDSNGTVLVEIPWEDLTTLVADRVRDAKSIYLDRASDAEILGL